MGVYVCMCGGGYAQKLNEMKHIKHKMPKMCVMRLTRECAKEEI